MRIDKITNLASDATSKLGQKLINGKTAQKGASKVLRTVNNLFQGEGINPGRAAYYFLMTGCVIAPRLIQAREPDEFREIATRDVITVLTILFAMKGLKSGMCMSAQNKGGVVLVQDAVGKNASKLKRLGGYLNPEGGICALDSNEIIARYSSIKSKKSLVDMLETVDREGGSVAKMFAVEKQEGIISKLLKKLPFGKKDEGTPLLDAAKKLLGEDFESKSNKELIDIIKNVTDNNTTAMNGLEQLIGSEGIGANKGAQALKGILNNPENPITNYARNISANFETLSLAITAGFLGFGLPKFNEMLTKKKHLQGPNRNSIEKKMAKTAASSKNEPFKVVPENGAYKLLANKDNGNAFKSFIG